MDQTQKHILKNTWTIWIHDIYDKKWNIESYRKIYTFNTIEDFWTFYNNVDCFDKYMFFLMKNNIRPIWEDNCNIEGGAFSFIVSKNVAKKNWLDLSMKLIGETITTTNMDEINGASYSPKSNVCIIKIWNKNCRNMFNLEMSHVKLRYKPHK